MIRFRLELVTGDRTEFLGRNGTAASGSVRQGAFGRR